MYKFAIGYLEDDVIKVVDGKMFLLKIFKLNTEN